MKNKIEFTVGDTKLAAVRPNVKTQEAAQLIYAQAFAKQVQAKVLLKAKLEAELRQQNLWDDARQAEFDKLSRRMKENLLVVQGKVKGTTLAKGRTAAIQLRRDRAEARALTAERVTLEANTAEGQAENARFNYLVSACTVHPETKKPYYESYEDYMGREADDVAATAASKFAELYYDIDPDTEKKRPENTFLRKFGFANEDGHLVNKDGHLVDVDGRRVDAEGRYLAADGKSFVDRDGNPVDEEGEPVGETYPFTDEPEAPKAQSGDAVPGV